MQVYRNDGRRWASSGGMGSGSSSEAAENQHPSWAWALTGHREGGLDEVAGAYWTKQRNVPHLGMGTVPHCPPASRTEMARGKGVSPCAHRGSLSGLGTLTFTVTGH